MKIMLCRGYPPDRERHVITCEKIPYGQGWEWIKTRHYYQYVISCNKKMYIPYLKAWWGDSEFLTCVNCKKRIETNMLKGLANELDYIRFLKENNFKR